MSVTAKQRRDAWISQVDLQLRGIRAARVRYRRALLAKFSESRQEVSDAGMDLLKHGGSYVNPNRQKMP